MVVPAVADLGAPRVADDDTVRRERIRALLAGGLITEFMPRGDSHEAIQAIVARLQGAADLEARLVIGGFTLHPVEHDGIEQACETCMYYLVHRRYCELPELDVPAEPEWSCRLWRI
jgi:hypothetical protein